jgi:hypothetical protein
MARDTNPEGVPLTVWLVTPAGDDPNHGAARRRRLAALVLDAYCPPGGVTADFAPGRGEVLAAATATGRSAIALLPSPLCQGRPPASLRDLRDRADLAVALPPESHLGPLRPHPLSSAAVDALARRAELVLRPGGMFVVGTVAAASSRDVVAESIEAATCRGLGYFQHVVAFVAPEVTAADAAPTDEDRRVGHVDLLAFVRGSR